MQSLDFEIALCAVIIFTASIIPVLYNFKLNLEIKEIGGQKFSDYCNIAYISAGQIETQPVKVDKEWCLAKTTGSQVRGWNEFFS